MSVGSVSSLANEAATLGSMNISPLQGNINIDLSTSNQILIAADNTMKDVIGSSAFSTLTDKALISEAIDINNDIDNPFDITENKDYNTNKSHDLEIGELINKNSLELRSLWSQIYHTSDGLTFQTRNISRIRRVYNCITGHELVQWLIDKKSLTKDQAIVIGQALVHAKWLECTPNSGTLNNQIFYDNNSFYKPGPMALNSNNKQDNDSSKRISCDTEEGPDWIRELNKLVKTIDDNNISSKNSSYNDLNSINKDEGNVTEDEEEDEKEEIEVDSNKLGIISSSSSSSSIKINVTNTDNKETVEFDFSKNEEKLTPPTITTLNKDVIRPPSPSPSTKDDEISCPPSPTTLNNTSQLPSQRTVNDINEDLNQIHKYLQEELFKQLLKLYNINFEWFDVVMPLVWRCVHLVRPDVKHDNDSMDIRSYIKIKKIPAVDKTKQDCRIINGLVFTKNVAHKNMKNVLKSPKILLFRSSIEYQRTEQDRMCSLEPIFTAEEQYLKNYCTKLLLRQNPEILIVEKSVARIAQEILMKSGITLILNCKSNIMEKLCRFLQADPMYSIDDLARKPKLGFCSNFHVDVYRMSNGKMKSFMFFEGTPTNLGCTLLLSGASLKELTIIKRLTRFMIYVSYNSKLEHSFILDKCADFNVKSVIYNHQVLTNEQQETLEKEKNTPTDSPLSIQRKKFKLLLNNLFLSISPFVHFDIPFLLRESNELKKLNDTMHAYLPDNYCNYFDSIILNKESNGDQELTSIKGNFNSLFLFLIKLTSEFIIILL
jgi:hypothetical protein